MRLSVYCRHLCKCIYTLLRLLKAKKLLYRIWECPLLIFTVKCTAVIALNVVIVTRLFSVDFMKHTS